MNLTKAPNSTHKTKRIGRGQGSGMGKTATKGGKGQTARKGYNEKRGFEGGQQPLQRRLPKVGFTSKFTKPYTINVEKVKAVKDLAEISFESLKSVHKFPKSVEKIKLIGVGARDLASKIKDKNISTSGGEKSAVAKKATAAKTAAKSKTAAADENSQNGVNSSENSAPKAENSSKAQKNSQKSVNSKAENSKKAEKAPAEKKAENSAKAKTEKTAKKPAAKKESEAK